MNKIQPKRFLKLKNSHYLPSCHSTNDVALEMIQKGDAENGTIVITDHQTNGKGQRGNVWKTEKGQNLTFSLILVPDFLLAAEQFQLNFVVANALKSVVDRKIESTVKIKWPNDLMHNDKKVGGILIENVLSGKKINHCVVGVGLNVNQTNFEFPTATSLKNISAQDFDLEELAIELIEEIIGNLEKLKKGGLAILHQAFKNDLFWLNEKKIFEKENAYFMGTIVDVSVDGQLIMETNEGLMTFGIKEFKYVL